MIKLIEEIGALWSLVYVGKEPLLAFPTNQRAYDYLSALSITADEEEEPWPEGVYIVFVTEAFNKVASVPQIGKITKQKDHLRYESLLSPEYEEFRQRIVDNWPSIKEGLKTS